ncbi:exonuclease SbcCD subunit D [Selenomonas sp. TAMA-11512]|uniref:exonuclease SbcCD subunit D n=1 Tax=Selenomonas sp. TAMA-11512 TaxID=3095337 RepID=UPI0030859C56|nr:exonuclease SbcCD subunit D [Selenomonas sp. TAMA-11512]
MRFLHTADWHLGKIFYGHRLTDDQSRILLDQFLHIIDDEGIECVMIAGDIYDRAAPPPEAVALFDEIITKLVCEKGVRICCIAGNHDNGTRVGFGSALLEASGLFVRGAVTKASIDSILSPVLLDDTYGKVAVTLLPYHDPADINHAMDAETGRDFNAAMEVLAGAAAERIPKNTRSVLLAHAFVAGASASGSEKALSTSVGGSDNVSYTNFLPWSYTCLGHLHGAQAAGEPKIRYSGSLMKYSANEAAQEKSVTVVDLDADGKVTTSAIPLTAPRDVRVERGLFEHLLSLPKSNDFISFELEDEHPVLNAHTRLAEHFPNLLPIRRLSSERRADAEEPSVPAGRESLQRSDEEIFSDFFKGMTQEPLSDKAKEILASALEEIAREEREA